MLKMKTVFLLLPILASLGSVVGELSQYQLKQLCDGKSLEILAYPGEPNKFVVCLHNGAKVGECRNEADPTDATKQIQTCFDESKQKCSLDFCIPEKPTSEYDKFVVQYCKDDANWLERLPAEDCEHYYVCLGSSNEPLRQTCYNAMHFSRVTKKCESPIEASCQSLDSMCKNKQLGYRFPSTNCYNYYECRFGKPTERTCPYGGHYDPVSKKCIEANNSQCIDQTNRPPKCTIQDNGLYFKHTECDRFYVCINTVALEAQCPQDYFYDEKTQMCKKDTTGVCRT